MISSISLLLSHVIVYHLYQYIQMILNKHISHSDHYIYAVLKYVSARQSVGRYGKNPPQPIKKLVTVIFGGILCMLTFNLLIKNNTRHNFLFLWGAMGAGSLEPYEVSKFFVEKH